MTDRIFESFAKVRYAGPDSDDPLAFRHYDAEKRVLGKSMAEHLRFAVCYWHSFAWGGNDMFGGPTFDRPWFNGALTSQAQAELKLTNAFDFFERLGAPFFCFHDVDAMAAAGTPAAHRSNLAAILDPMQARMAQSRVKLLWGTANLFSHPRYAAGAATSPDPEIFAWAALQVREMLNATHRLGGANYVLWGGREGYDTLLNTNLRQELNQLGRFLTMVVEHKHRIGFPARTRQAPVRPRRRHGLRFPQALRSRGRDQGQYRGQPCHACRKQLRTRDRHSGSLRYSGLDRHQPRRSAERLGY